MGCLKAVQIYVGPAVERLFIKIIQSSSRKNTLKNTHESGVMTVSPLQYLTWSFQSMQ